ncbi:MAG: PcfB family protein [Defluviitaleaceae bacterium]|nr:PcfB family protein [Defluviitaleaceae bacterium]
MKASLRKIHNARNGPKEGLQTTKQLAKGGKLENVEISNDNIKAFDPFARKYGIKYSLEKDNSETPPKWLVFFQSKDTATMTAAFKEFSAKMMTKDKSRPSVKDAMTRIKEIVQNVVRDKTRHKTHGEHER